MIERPPVCCDRTGRLWFIGARDAAGEWVYREAGGHRERFHAGELIEVYGPMTWFHLVENDLIDMEAPL